MSHNFSEQLLLKPMLPKDISQSPEGWAKRDRAKPKSASSKFYTVPNTVPVPERTKSTVKTERNLQKCTDKKNSSNDLTRTGSEPATEVDALWTCKPTEVVVAVLRHAEQKLNFTLRHREFQSLRPDELIIGEVMECYIRAINYEDTPGRLYHMNHYTMGVILHGTREQMARQGLKKVTFADYDGAIGFVNIRNVHWTFVYLHALSNHIFVVDPLQGSNEVEDSRNAGYRFEQYFKMRRNRFGKEDWVNIKWKPGKITHTFQKDGTSCGIFVMQIDASKQSLQNLRRDMADDILKGSVSKDEYCSFCGNEDLPQTADDAVWIQCGTCTRWFHTQCLGMTAARIPNKDTPWYCELCNSPNQ
ncbi:uncharacterized protein LOC117776943 isoform X2 [Hippoglossus hippoglossus]|uniref:uncharacterized protein LOC117776943 isoform X2 n=1 Tax=Hippoglossus hippoglossus TaxID=8267 RepID=UPI00148CDC1F|nr:uncharacterized protein LOC117776943 isoform X2 [Hippoglossus hippoglossus]